MGLKQAIARLSNSRQLASDVGWVMLLRLVRQATSILVVAVLVRIISQEDFGRYQLAIVLVGVFGFAALPGMQNAIIQSVARGHEGTFRIGTRWAFRASWAGGAMIGVVAGYFWYRGETDQALALAVAAAMFPASQGLNQWQSLQLGRKQFRENTIRLSFGMIGSSVAVAAVALAGFKSPAALVAASFGVLAIQNIIQQRISLASVPVDAEPEPASISYGVSASKWDVLNTIANYIDRLLVYSLGSFEALAIYAVADRIPEVLKTNQQQMVQVLIPRLAKRSSYTKAIDRKLNIAAAAWAVGVVVFAFALIPFLLPLLYTKAYAGAVIYCQLILVSVAIGGFAVTKRSYLNAQLDIASVRSITLWMSLVRLISSAVLVWYFNALGAAMSSIIYRLSTVALVEYHLRKHMHD